MNDWLAPPSAAVLRVGPHPKLVGRVGLEVVDDRVAAGAGLVGPFPVPLAVTHRVVTATEQEGPS